MIISCWYGRHGGRAKRKNPDHLSSVFSCSVSPDPPTKHVSSNLEDIITLLGVPDRQTEDPFQLHHGHPKPGLRRSHQATTSGAKAHSRSGGFRWHSLRLVVSDACFLWEGVMASVHLPLPKDWNCPQEGMKTLQLGRWAPKWTFSRENRETLNLEEVSPEQPGEGMRLSKD